MKLIRTFSRKIADFQATVFLTLCFFLLVPLFALIAKSSRKADKPIWTSWDMLSDTLDDIRRQY